MFKHGIRAVISHTFPNESEQPIAFASKTLLLSEKLCKLEKEAPCLSSME